MKAKKSYGQHFLTNTTIAERIAQSLTGLGGYQHVLEIGPGQGMLTQFLLQQPYQLHVVEADHDMEPIIREKFPELAEHITILDVLRFFPKKTFGDDQFAVIGNFPYNISSQILFQVIKWKSQVPEMVGMFQKEVAMRVASGPGSKVYGVISVLIQAWYETEVLFHVSPGNFNPPPKVQSSILRLQRKPIEHMECDEGLFKHIVKTSFQQRRKMLRNTLKGLVPDSEKALLEEPMFRQRPEQLGLEEFIELTKTFETFQSK